MIKRFADRLLRWYCHPDYYPDISGDLEELYLRNRQSKAGWTGWRHFWQVLLLFRPSLLRPFGQQFLPNDTGMFKNYLKISLRNLARHKVYTGINIIGLAVGLGAFLLINQYLQFEKSYDRYFRHSDQLYRLTTDQVVEGVLGTRDAMSFYPSAKALMEEIPEVVNGTVTRKFSELTFQKGDQLITERGVIAADSNFLNIFPYPLVYGNPEKQLADPNTLVLTESKARKYFGNENPVGKTIHIFSGHDKAFKVTGVIKDSPQNTHYRFDVLMSISTIRERLERDGWSGFNYYTYLQLAPDADMQKIESMLPDLSGKYIGEENTLRFNLQPVPGIHLYSDFTFEPEAHGSAKSVRFLTIISIFILLIAWVNYINLSTARAVDRAKEVGLRKVIGAQKRQLISQFLMESFLINFLGALVALIAAQLMIPSFNQLVGKEVIHQVWNTHFLINLGIFFLMGTFLSGFYPALVLSGFKPVSILKGKFRNSKSGVVLRKSLVVLQFTASFILIAGTFIVYMQVRFMQSRDIGISTDQVIGFSNPRPAGDWDAFREKKLAFLDEVRKHHAVLGAARMSNLPGGGSSDINSSSGGIKIVGLTERLDATTYIQSIDENVMDLLDMQLISGRNFLRNSQADSNSVIVNEAFVTRFGLPVTDDLLHQKIQFGRDAENDKYSIIGVMKDVNRSTLKKTVEPTVYMTWSDPGNSIVKLSAENLQAGVEHVENTWNLFFPTESFNYNFLDQRYAQLYDEDKRFGSVFGVFSVFAILVASLGLFGLASFLAMQRTKEVGVRKVLGASVSQIVSIFYKDFVKLIGMSVVLGGIVTYYGISFWLRTYAYRIDFPWIVIGIATLILLTFAFITVGYQTYKVAILNPAQTLKYE